MKKLLKVLVLILVLLVFLAGISVVAVLLFGNKIAGRAAKTAVETAGTKMLGVGVTVGKANASIFTGAVGLQDILVKNPSGYKGPALVKLARVDAKADTKSLLSKEVLIKDMKLDNMEVFVEQQGLQNNLYQVIKPLRESHQPTGRSLVIDNLTLTNVTVHVSMPALAGKTQSADLKLDSIAMGNLGRSEKMDTAVLIGKILLAVAQGIAEKGSGILPKDMAGDLGSVLDKAVDIGKTILTPGGKTPDGKQQDSLGKSVTDGIKGLLGGKKKQ
jgi:hypothetical protein